MAQSYLELEPISETHPAGSDVRYETEYEQLQAEIDKLSLPSATSAVDWFKVRQLSSDILQTKCKDLLVGSYFTIAEIRINKLQGLETGLTIYSGLLENYWDNLFPTKKRMRGRIAAINLLLEKCETAFDGLEVDPIEPDFALALKEKVNKIDSLLQQYLDDPPLLRPLERMLEELPIKEQSVIPETAAPPLTEQSKEAEEVVRETPQQPEEQQPQPKPVPPAPTVPAGDNVSGAEMEKIVRAAFLTIKQAADFYFNKDISNPRGYRCRRIAGWSLIQTLPPSTHGQTQIPPPGELEEIRKKLLEMRSLNKFQELLRESEQRLSSSLLWLDLNRFSAESLEGLGSQYQDAHDAVCQETAFLLKRLPGLEKLSFADGSPLADPETRHWLETIMPDSGTTLQAPAQVSSQSNEHMEKILEQAQSLASGKKVTEAVHLLSAEMQHSPSGRERILWRLNLAQLLINSKHTKLALPHLDEIVQNIDSFQLDKWDPELATHALCIVWGGYKHEKTTRDKAEQILTRIAKLNPVSAMQLNK